MKHIMKKFEYRKERVYAPNDELEDILNEKGQEGWECVGFEYDRDNYYDIVLKREVEV